MPRRFLKRLLPDPNWMRQHKSLQPLSRLLHDPNLWHLNRHSVSVAAFVGIFIAFIPLPIHMIGAAIAAVWLRCNLSVAVALVWVTNPLTIPPIFYGSYRMGSWMLGVPVQDLAFELSIDWVSARLGGVWEPLLLGCATAGLAFGLLAYLSVRVFWRVGVQWKWRRRQRLRTGRRDHS